MTHTLRHSELQKCAVNSERLKDRSFDTNSRGKAGGRTAVAEKLLLCFSETKPSVGDRLLRQSCQVVEEGNYSTCYKQKDKTRSEALRTRKLIRLGDEPQCEFDDN